MKKNADYKLTESEKEGRNAITITGTPSFPHSSMKGYRVEQVKAMQELLADSPLDKYLFETTINNNKEFGHTIEIEPKTDFIQLKKFFSSEIYMTMSGKNKKTLLINLNQFLEDILAFSKEQKVLLRTVGWQGEQTHNHWWKSQLQPLLKALMGAMSYNPDFAFKFLSNTPVGILNSVNIVVTPDGNIKFLQPYSDDLDPKKNNQMAAIRRFIGEQIIKLQQLSIKKKIIQSMGIDEFKDMPLYNNV